MVVARTGPTSLTRANSSMKAAAVQITASTTTEATTLPDGMVDGTPSPTRTIGTYISAVSVRADAMIPMPGMPCSGRARIAGPMA